MCDADIGGNMATGSLRFTSSQLNSSATKGETLVFPRIRLENPRGSTDWFGLDHMLISYHYGQGNFDLPNLGHVLLFVIKEWGSIIGSLPKTT